MDAVTGWHFGTLYWFNTTVFSNLGYSEDLEFASEQTIVLATHSEQAVTVIRVSRFPGNLEGCSFL